MKVLAALALVLLLSGCGAWERSVASVTGYSTICVNGVSYIQFISGVTVEYTKDGKIKNC